MPAPPSTSHVSLPSQNGAMEFIIWSRSRSVSANGNNMPIPRSKPSRITYIATAWAIDLLGADFLAPTSSVLTSIDDAAGCRFDLKIVFDDGTTQTRRNVNVCGVEKYGISFR